jgi:alkylhydroperoxidase/carboxymuconolactone decarboxylase family protein YurZ
MAIADDIRPGDDSIEVSEKLVGRQRTRNLREMLDFLGLPTDVIDLAFGNLYTRDVLSQKQRELCAVAALCVLERKNELKSHIIAALRTGASKKEVAEVLFQMAVYGGVPVSIEGLNIAREVFEKSAEKEK